MAPRVAVHDVALAEDRVAIDLDCLLSILLPCSSCPMAVVYVCDMVDKFTWAMLQMIGPRQRQQCCESARPKHAATMQVLECLPPIINDC